MTLNQKEFIGDKEDTQHGRFLTFSLGEEYYGLEIRTVIEIVGIQPITRLPEAPDYIKGVINLRGKIIPVIDVRLKFKEGQAEYNDRTCIIVIETQGIIAGLIVDNVSEVISISDENIVPPPDDRTGLKIRYIRGIGKVGDSVKLLLDCDMLFNGNEIDTFRELEGETL